MKRTRKKIGPKPGAAFLAVLTLVGCDAGSPSEHVPEIVVESYQVAGLNLRPVWVTISADVDDRYDVAGAAVDDAVVRVYPLSISGERESAWIYEQYPGFPGEYRAVDEHEVQGGREYELEVLVTGFDVVTAQTHVPGAFDLISSNAGALPFQGDAQFEFNVTKSAYPGRQSVYIFSVVGLNPKIGNLTPFYLDDIYGIREGASYNPDELDPAELTDVLVNSSPPINEGNYDVLSDGSLVVQLPWFAVAFYGETDVVMNAIDENTYDFVRYQMVQQGGSSLSPGEIPNVLDRVENGRGLFGSLARATVRVVVQR